MDKSPQPGPWLLPRIGAVIVIFLTLVAAGLESMSVSAAIQPSTPAGVLQSAIAVVIVTVAGGIVGAIVLECLARIGARSPSVQPAAVAGSAGLSLDSINDSLARIESVLPTAIADSLLAVLPVSQSGESAGSNFAMEEHLAAMVKLLEEIKDVSMLDENQRQARRQQIVTRRRASRLEEADRLIAQRSWEQADAVLHLLESLHPGDPDVLFRRTRMDDARQQQLVVDWEKLARQVEDQMALGRFGDAAALVEEFRQSYPNHGPGVDLADRVNREAEVYTERAVTRAFDEIKAAVESRHWRAALTGTQKFLDRFPDHHRSEKIRQQFHVIQKNAETEERQQQEEQLNQLIKSHRYGEAFTVGEDILARFPESPQAGRISDLLPRLREKAVEAGEVVGS